MPQFSESETPAPAEEMLRLPIGVASPLWFAYAAAASAGVAYWWMTRLAKPMNLEAFAFNMPALAEAPTFTQALAAIQPEPVALDPAPEAKPVEIVLEAAAEAAEPVAEAAQAAVETGSQALAESVKVVSIAADDLTRLVGIGPTLAGRLADLGVKTYADIAAWTEGDLEKFDKTLDLKGRAVREGWVDQARQFTAQ